MRISTQTMYAQSMLALNQQQADLVHIGQQIATGRRVLNPSDDPEAATQALRVDQASAVNDQYTSARVGVRNALSMEESVLGSVGDAVASAKTLILAAANGTLSDADRASIAIQLQSIYQTVLGQANATDGNGRYLFGGYQDGAPPYSGDAGAVAYNVPDALDKPRQQQIDASRMMPVADTGSSVFKGGGTDLFKTFEDALAALNHPADTAADEAALQATLGNAMTEFDKSLDNVLMVRASVGSRLNELDVVDKVSGNRNINYAQTKSDLVDLDYTTAISDYSLRQVGLQAAQKAFVSMKQMNLFDLL